MPALFASKRSPGKRERRRGATPHSIAAQPPFLSATSTGRSEHDSVVDSFGKLHGSSNLFILGGSTFVGTSGALNPTLTMVALAIRSADYIVDRNL